MTLGAGFRVDYQLAAVRTPLPDPERRVGDSVSVSFDITMNISVPRHTVGFAEPTIRFAELLTTYRPTVSKWGSSDVTSLTVEVEATATVIENGYKDVTFGSVRVKQPGEGLFGYAASLPSGDQPS